MTQENRAEQTHQEPEINISLNAVITKQVGRFNHVPANYLDCSAHLLTSFHALSIAIHVVISILFFPHIPR